jgi:hypothetical protein
MVNIKNPRLRRPAVTAIGGSAIAVAALISSGWQGALVVETVTVAAAFGYYVLGGRDSDFGAVMGSHTDERQSNIGMRARSLAACVMGTVAAVGFVIATARGSATWPFELVCGVGAASFLAGLVIFRAGGSSKALHGAE